MTPAENTFHESAHKLLVLLRKWQEERDELERFLEVMRYRPLTRPEARIAGYSHTCGYHD